MKSHNLTRKVRKSQMRPLAMAGLLALLGATAWNARAAEIDISAESQAKEEKWRQTDYTFSRLDDTLRIQVTGTLAAGYDDNVYSTHDKDGSFFVTPGLSLTLNWFPHPNFFVTANAGVGFRFYSNSDVDNEVVVSGDAGEFKTSIQGNLKLGQKGDIVIGNDISRTSDALDLGSARSKDSYTRTINDTYLRYSNWVNEVTYGTASYTHTFGWIGPDEYKYESYQADTFDFSLMYGGIVKQLYVGPYFTYITRYYDESANTIYGEIQRDDSDSISTGLAFNYEIDRTLFFQGRLGYTWLTFSDDNPLTWENGYGLTYDAQLTYLRGEKVTHTLFSSNSLEEDYRSLFVNYAKTWTVGYSYRNRVADKWTLSGDIIFRNVNESDSGDDYNLIRPGIGVAYEINPRTTLSARYEYTNHFDSAVDENDYDRNRISVTIAYKF
ncbi:MAG: outer membrane beta-barrel protein [Lentisphaeria bacterium]